MAPFRWRLLVLAAAAGAGSERVAACDWGYQTLPELYDMSSDVFIGTVIAEPDTPTPSAYRFKVLTRFKGATGDEVVLSRTLGDCEYPFLQGATYMVHAFVSERRLVSGQFSRPILMDTRESARSWSPELAAAYANARARQQPHAFVWGSLSGISGDVTVHAEREDGEPVTVRAPNTPWPVYEILIPPGTYRIGLRLNGTQVGDTVTLSLKNGESRMVHLGSPK